MFGHTPLKLLWSAELHHPNKSWTFPAEGWKLEIEPAHWIVHGFPSLAVLESKAMTRPIYMIGLPTRKTIERLLDSVSGGIGRVIQDRLQCREYERCMDVLFGADEVEGDTTLFLGDAWFDWEGTIR